MFQYRLGAVALAVATLLASPLLWAKPVVVASVKPLAMIVAAVAGDECDVRTLLPANASPHDYALRFSDIRQLREAELVVWVGPELEGFLAKPISQLPAANRLSLSARKNPGLERTTDREHYNSAHQGDPHIWLNPENAAEIAKKIAIELGQILPDKKQQLEQNSREFVANLAEMDKKIAKRFETSQESGFVVLHDAYSHFVEYYGLRQLAAVRLGSGGTRGAKHQSELLSLAHEKSGVACVFTEPQFGGRSAEILAQKLGANVALLDPMGGNILLSENAYIKFMDEFSGNMAACLQ